MQELEATKAHDAARTLRLWPGILIVVVQWLLRFVVPAVYPDALPVGVFGGLLGGPAVALWWLFFSRAPQAERWGALGLTVVALVGTFLALHESLATGMMGLVFPVFAVPVLSLAFVCWAVLTRELGSGTRRVTLVAAVVLACLPWTLLRTGGFSGDLDHDFAWRWTPTPEERLLALGAEEFRAPEPVEGGAAEWSGFRGPARDGVVAGVRIDPDWAAAPPQELWRRAIGPGWSSFAVHGANVYTQEQRGEEEVVSCYDLATGAPVWRHADQARFWESNAGAGPRGTPTYHAGRIYTLGATGILNALDAASGAALWTRNAQADTGAELPGWAFSGSPLVVDDLIVVAVAGALIAYDLESGEVRWQGTNQGGGYSSPQLFTLDGVEQLLFLSGAGASGRDPTDGALLWEYAWEGDPITQPAASADGGVLITAGGQSGVRRLDVAQAADGWTVTERWTSIRLKPFYNDFVVHAGHAYGFDGGSLACIDVAEGKRAWKGGRYGHGQLVLLTDQELLLVISEEGELVVVDARPGEFSERARFPAIEGKTWNHPVLIEDVLLVRNAAEMAAFRLSPLSE